MSLGLLTDDAALHALGPAWDALWHRTPDAAPFLSPRWLLPWWRAFGTGRPHVATLHRGGELAGVLPLYVFEGRLLPLGAGTSDLLDVLGESDDLLTHALDQAHGIDACDLLELPPGARLLQARTAWASEARETDPCPALALAGSLEQCVPAPVRRKLRMSQHRADRAGGAQYETAVAGSLARMQASLEALHQERWSAQGEPGSFGDALVIGMHREAAPLLLEAGLLRLCTVELRGEVAAAILALLAPGRIFFYASGFDARSGFESPGTLLLGHMLEAAIAEGRTEANFLRGGEAYKYAWGAVDRRNSMRLLRRG